MLLTIQQKCIMEILQKLGCIRRDQLLTLLRGRYREQVKVMRPEHLTPMLRQLVGISRAVCVEGEVIRLTAQTADPLYLEAIDVMLELTSGCPIQFSRSGMPSALLCFLYGDALTACYIMPLEAGTMPLLHHSKVAETERFIWLTGKTSPCLRGEIPDGHIFAQQQKDGTHRFFANKHTTL